MYGLIMAGGLATRLHGGEKALIRVFDKPLIKYVLDTIKKTNLQPVIITSHKTPLTNNYCRAHNLDFIEEDGNGYVNDLISAVEILEITGPFLTICVDILGISDKHLDEISNRYKQSGKPALSVWIPLSCYEKTGVTPQYIEKIDGIDAAPAGINILLGEIVKEEQTEERMIISSPALTFNLNTPDDLLLAEKFFNKLS